MQEKEWVVGPSWVNLAKRLHALAGESNIEIEITGKEFSLISQRVDYKISGPRHSLNSFNKRLIGEGLVKFIGVA